MINRDLILIFCRFFICGCICLCIAAIAPKFCFSQNVKELIVEETLDAIEEIQGTSIDETFIEEIELEEPEEYVKYMIDELQVTNMPIKDVLELIYVKSGLNIITEEDLPEEISIYLRYINAFDVLRIILDSSDLAYEEIGDIVHVITDEDFKLHHGFSFRDKIQTKIVKLEHAEASVVALILENMKSDVGRVIVNNETNTIALIGSLEDLNDMVDFIKQVDVEVEVKVFVLEHIDCKEVAKESQSLLTENVGKIEIDEKENKITVTDIPSVFENISNLIKRLDYQGRRIVLEAEIIQIVLNEEHQAGVDWRAILSDYKDLNLTALKQVLNGSLEKLSVGTVSIEDYAILSDALDTVGVIKTIFNSNIDMIKDELSKIALNITDSVSSKLNEDLEEETFELNMQLASHIKGEGLLSLDIIPKFILSERDTSEIEEQLFSIDTKNDSVVVIGGLFQNVKSESLRKVPFLGSIPLLGVAFRGQRTDEQKTEIVIFLTPKIVARGN
ncbi:MAG: hypothetical protein P9X22_05400 [Candidatus Zapsychrus exili]|nr:hypothetical protein [Candidatus Zapsychrus exili]